MRSVPGASSRRGVWRTTGRVIVSLVVSGAPGGQALQRRSRLAFSCHADVIKVGGATKECRHSAPHTQDPTRQTTVSSRKRPLRRRSSSRLGSGTGTGTPADDNDGAVDFSDRGPSAEWELPPCWAEVLREEVSSARHRALRAFVAEERARATVYPAPRDTLRALRETPFEAVKVVVVGQDPYHGPGQAHGLAFSVPAGVPPPPSLRNILRELRDDILLGGPHNGDESSDGGKENVAPGHGGDLSGWARQGVLLLNAVLTVRRGEPLSHAGHGWEPFTDAACEALARRGDVVFLLWGNKAKAKLAFSKTSGEGLTKVRRLEAAHPSPLSAHRGFFGSRPFSRCNAELEALGKAPICWTDWTMPAAAPDDGGDGIIEPSLSPHSDHSKSSAASSDDVDALAPENILAEVYAKQRLVLRCPYVEKDDCKALGARWDPQAKTWFVDVADPVEEARARRDFARWLPQPERNSLST